MSLFIVSLPLIPEYSNIEFVQTILSNNFFLIVITVLLTYLMNAEIPLFSLKFKNYNISNNKIKYIFLLVSLGLIIGLQFLAVPLIIIIYVLFSLILGAKK
jgi:CDP-diacylglycerol--serine O-phosphatidyltransferase